MATLTTKYSIGDVVWHASTMTEQKQHPCPDCLGTRKWKATSPAGAEYEFGCPRCGTRYHHNRDLQLDYTAHVAHIERLTIGSIQYNTASGIYDHGARYMCRETGVGSGSVYNESDLYETEEAAQRAAEAIAALNNSSVEWVVKLYDKSLELSDYQLDSAALKLAKEAESRSRSLLWNLEGLFGSIEEADDKEAILELLNDYKNYDWKHDKKELGDAATDIMKLHDETMSALTEAAP
jgi:hypothetical protein